MSLHGLHFLASCSHREGGDVHVGLEFWGNREHVPNLANLHTYIHTTPQNNQIHTAIMSNPRIEEVYDDASDPDEMDLDAFDFARPGQTTLQQAQQQSQAQQQQQPNADMMAQMQQILGGGGAGGMPPQMDQKERMRLEREQQEKCKSYQCIYPIYFDASRSREEGRRVGKDLAVKNPLARDIVDALQQISGQVHVALQIVFEPSKCHPKDWANPGRVKILIKKDGKPVTAKIANSEFLSNCCFKRERKGWFG
jgi:signal recognition particle subunit SRP19